MGLPRAELNIGEYIRADEIWYGIDRTEGGLGLKIPVRSEKVMQKKMIEAQLILNVAYDLIRFCRVSHRGDRKIKDVENLEIDQITAENPANAGVRLIDSGAAVRDPYYIKIFLNKTFGINNLNITWGMCSDEALLIQYMNDLKRRFGTKPPTEEERKKVEINLNFAE
ncbi:MAG: hypothetical protein ABIK62_04160 [candidate division WOR-3 bacterium]